MSRKKRIPPQPPPFVSADHCGGCSRGVPCDTWAVWMDSYGWSVGCECPSCVTKRAE